MNRLYQGKRTAIPAELVKPLLTPPAPFVGIDWSKGGSQAHLVTVIDGKVVDFECVTDGC